MITEDYVSFEIAKLLKEKGFDENCSRSYVKDKLTYSQGFNNSYYMVMYTDETYRPISAPTLQMVMKWLREAHNIDISVVPHSHKEGKTFEYEFVYWNGEEYHVPYSEQYPTYHELFGKTWEKYEEACEAAIKYCLENLI